MHYRFEGRKGAGRACQFVMYGLSKPYPLCEKNDPRERLMNVFLFQTISISPTPWFIYFGRDKRISPSLPQPGSKSRGGIGVLFGRNYPCRTPQKLHILHRSCCQGSNVTKSFWRASRLIVKEDHPTIDWNQHRTPQLVKFLQFILAAMSLVYPAGGAAAALGVVGLCKLPGALQYSGSG